jgi:hypothetical protein
MEMAGSVGSGSRLEVQAGRARLLRSRSSASSAGASLSLFEVAHFVSHPISLRDSVWFFVLVLRVSSTRTLTRRYGNEYDYEYHFIDYEYERNRECATSKLSLCVLDGSVF